jgi:hypothetical protein
MRLTIEVSDSPAEARAVLAEPPQFLHQIGMASVPAGAFNGGADTAPEPPAFSAAMPPEMARGRTAGHEIARGRAAEQEIPGAPAGAINMSEAIGEPRSAGAAPSARPLPQEGSRQLAGIAVNIEPGAGPVIG